MRLEEQVKAINKQIAFLEKYKDSFTKGKQDKIAEFNYTVECLKDAAKVLSNLSTTRDSLINSLESLRGLTNNLIT